MKEIHLTQNQVTLVDDKDFDELSKYRWYAHWNPKAKCYYAVKSNSYKSRSMARFIMNCPADKMVDHRNHNTLNNQRQNLRICSNQENKQNARADANSSSKYKGVTWARWQRKWTAQIQLRDMFDQPFNKKLGNFNSENEAALAYNKAAEEHFGEFACLNQIDKL